MVNTAHKNKHYRRQRMMNTAHKNCSFVTVRPGNYNSFVTVRLGDHTTSFVCEGVAQLAEHPTNKLGARLMRVQFPGAARDFFLRVAF